MRPISPQLVADLGQRPLRNPEQLEQLGVPGRPPDVEEHRPRGVGGIGDELAGQLEDEPGVDGAEHRPVRLGARSRRPSTFSSSHSILVAQKYGSSTSPVRSRISSS